MGSRAADRDKKRATETSSELIRRGRGQTSIVTLDQFLGFVRYNEYFSSLGYMMRSRLLNWLKDEPAHFDAWMPAIVKAQPEFFEYWPRDMDALMQLERDMLKIIGIIGWKPGKKLNAAFSQTPGDGANHTSPADPAALPPSSRESGLRSPAASDAGGSGAGTSTDGPGSGLGKSLPDTLLARFPDCAGQSQEEVWLKDMKAAKEWMGLIRTWFTKTARDLGPEDPMTWKLIDLKDQIPTFALEVDRARLCLEDAQSKHRASVARRSRVSSSFMDLNPGAKDDDEGPSRKRRRGTPPSGTASSFPSKRSSPVMLSSASGPSPILSSGIQVVVPSSSDRPLRSTQTAGPSSTLTAAGRSGTVLKSQSVIRPPVPPTLKKPPPPAAADDSPSTNRNKNVAASSQTQTPQGSQKSHKGAEPKVKSEPSSSQPPNRSTVRVNLDESDSE